MAVDDACQFLQSGGEVAVSIEINGIWLDFFLACTFLVQSNLSYVTFQWNTEIRQVVT